MRILVLGSGAREHALSWRLALDPGVRHVICAPGNPGIGRTVELAPVDASNPAEVFALAESVRADLTVVGAEAPLAAGIADYFADADARCSAPHARPPNSKPVRHLPKTSWRATAFPRRGIGSADRPTKRCRVVRDRELGEAVVVKADGLAAGKGVVVAPDPDTAGRRFGPRWWTGPSAMRARRSSWKSAWLGPKSRSSWWPTERRSGPSLTAQDHKRIFDGDEGPNTGGMGAFCPSPLVDVALQQRIEKEIVTPVLAGMASEGSRSAASSTAG